MASWHDLEQKVQYLRAVSGLTIESAYRGEGVPKWLQPALNDDCDVFIVNAKGVKESDTLCVVKLSWLQERLDPKPF